MFMNSCTVFVFFSLIEYAIVNVMMGDISDIERRDKEPSSPLKHSFRNIVKLGHNKLARKTTICINKVCPIFRNMINQRMRGHDVLTCEGDMDTFII